MPRDGVHAKGADGFELAHDGGAIGGDRGADARDHRVKAGQAFAVVMHLGGDSVDRHVTARGVDHFDDVAAFFALFHQTAGRIIVFARQHGDAQGAFGCDRAHILDEW